MSERAATVGDTDSGLDKHGTLVFRHNSLPSRHACDPRFDTGHTGGSGHTGMTTATTPRPEGESQS